MSIRSITVEPTTEISEGCWRTLEAGAERYGYDPRHFSRLVHDGRILGATFKVGRWESHQEGIAGSIPDKWCSYALPAGTEGVAVELCSGLVSSRIYVRTCIVRKHPKVELRAAYGHSGPIVKITPTQTQ